MARVRVLVVNVAFLLISLCASQSDREACPMFSIQRDILKATINFKEADSRTLVILVREIMEEKYGGKWGVVIVDNPEAVDSSFHWNIPTTTLNGQPAFCVGTYQNRTYNVFKTDGF